MNLFEEKLKAVRAAESVVELALQWTWPPLFGGAVPRLVGARLVGRIGASGVSAKTYLDNLKDTFERLRTWLEGNLRIPVPMQEDFAGMGFAVRC